MPAKADKPDGGGARVRRGAKKKALTQNEIEPVGLDRPAQRGGMARLGELATATSVSRSDITTFLRQFIMLVESGTPILKALKNLAERGERGGVRALVADVAQYVEAGNALWQAFERHPRHFDTVFVNLIQASEASGTLVPVLQRSIKFRQRRDLLRKRVRGGMLYPAILLFACLAVVIFISMFVMPEFEEMFKKFGQDKLPPLTVAFMGVTHFVAVWWWAGILGLFLLGAAYKFWWVVHPLRRLAADRVKLRLPILGPILRKNAIVEMTRVLSLLLRSGLTMRATLTLVHKTIHNRAVAQIISEVHDSVERGAGIEKPLRDASNIIPGVVTDMLVTGEESGRLDSIAEQIADTYEEEVNIAIATLGEAIQPVLTVLIGIVVVLLMLAVFIPMISMLDTLGSKGL